MAKAASKATARVPRLRDIADKVAQSLDADIFLYNAPIERHHDQRVIELCLRRRRRRNIAMMLITEGGDADAAYRIAAALQQAYLPGRYIALVPGYCKSAGTLVVMGAHEVAMSSDGELGPLDIQVLEKDELVGMRSGLTATSALDTLNARAFDAFEYFMLQTIRKSRGAISTRTAAEIATRMACGLFTPVYKQVDPMHVGEVGRGLQIAKDYGRRLAIVAQNLKGDVDEALEHLVSHYPSHGFVIDLPEAEKIFKNARKFTAVESELTQCLGSVGRWPLSDNDKPWIGFLSSERAQKRTRAKSEKGTQANAGQAKPGSAPKTGSGTRVVPGLGGNGPAAVPAIAGIGRPNKRRS